MPTIDTPHGTVHYRTAGPADSTAPPVVLVHGLLVNGELWTGVATALAEQGIRSYAPDLPLGAHPIALSADADVSPRGVATLIEEFLDALGLSDVTLVGNDTGGALCQFLIDRSPDRIGRLVLTNCDAFDQFPPAPFGLLVVAGRRAWRLKALLAPMRIRALRQAILGPLVTNPLDPELTRRWVTPGLADAGVRRDAARFMAQIRKDDLLDVSTRLARFAKPVRLVWGAADRFFPLAFAERLRDAFADATLVTVADGRTFLPIDDPVRVADEIASLVRSG